MKQAIIIHGMPSEKEYFDVNKKSPSNSHWLPWIQKQLLINGYLAQTPEMPEPYSPNYNNWCRVFEQFDVDKDTTLIGHSCGAGFFLRWLSEHEINVEKLILVAPWIDPLKKLSTKFFDFTIAPQLEDKIGKIYLLNSDDDIEEIQTSVKIMRAALPKLDYMEFKDFGHFCEKDMPNNQFAELLDVIIS